MNMKIRLGIFALGTTLLAACGGGFSVDDIEDHAPQGTVAGASWTMKSAVVTDDGERLSVSLFPVEVTACDAFASSDTEILFSAPKKAGEYPLKLELTDLNGSQTITFVTAPGQNVVASEGILNVESISAEKVTIGLLAEADENTINGRFTSSICQGTN
ncbi:hypothetical protein [Polyangium sp. y55x31]|uniref:hypothetical protein n=1 Tax=Polyangium sp. y55x31 TaxID=3042688 RepID=UPI002482B6D1|nr:hypothetical protein [Polyangium sp. y55x31]MDI1476276.1 hypothetical protein [Polyangium sp. y55x31]